MPPPHPPDHPAFRLRLLQKPYVVTHLKAHESIPVKYLETLTHAESGSRFMSITRTAEEVSIVYEADENDGNTIWKCIKIAGPMDFGITGVMCSFSTPLNDSNIPIFAVSTWNTDYILVPKERSEQAVAALEKDGWVFDA